MVIFNYRINEIKYKYCKKVFTFGRGGLYLKKSYLKGLIVILKAIITINCSFLHLKSYHSGITALIYGQIDETYYADHYFSI